MRIKKDILFILSLSLVCLTLIGCQMNNENTKSNIKSVSVEKSKEIGKKTNGESHRFYHFHHRTPPPQGAKRVGGG